MKLDIEAFKTVGIKIPGYDREKMIEYTKENPRWIHFGAGNIFRGYIAGLEDVLIEQGYEKSGIIAAEVYDGELVSSCMRKFDNITVAVTLNADGGTDKKAVLSVAESLTSDDFERLCEIFENPSLQIVSLTVTEKGYALRDENGILLPSAEKDSVAGPNGGCTGIIGIIASLCWRRFKRNKTPLALVSMDNCSSNGLKLKQAIIQIAQEWVKAGKTESKFVKWLDNPQSVAFPWTMIDRITPAPSEKISEQLSNLGIPAEIIKTQKNSATALFVNMEETSYLVIEDSFPNGRPPLQKAGVLFAGRETVMSCESMKVYTCLNPLHTALAILGCLLGFDAVWKEMKDPDISRFINLLGRKEMLPVAVDPGIIDRKKFLDEVLLKRLPNPAIPDTPQRIATDTSLKMPVRYGNAIAAHRLAGTESQLKYIPFVIAAWCRYLVGLDDSGNRFVQSPDPALKELGEIFSALKLGSEVKDCAMAAEYILNRRFFDCDFNNDILKPKVIDFFSEMMSSAGSVRKLLSEITD